MKPEQQALFTDAIQREAALRFGLESDNITLLDGFENFICECSRNGTPYILRISHTARRSVNGTIAELDWIDYLASHRVPVCVPRRSTAGSLVEVIDGDDCGFIVVAFEKARGGLVRRDDQTPAMAVNRGRLLGRMHALTRSYEPSQGHPRRHHWYDDDDFVNYADYLRPDDTVVRERLADLIAQLRSIPVHNGNYGLIHMDAHTGNIFFDGDAPTLFDFDDCAYDFFTSDIAISLFYRILFPPPEYEPRAYAAEFLRHFLAGYQEENELDSGWSELMPLILKRREIILYVAIHRGMDMENLDEWCTRYMDGRRERIEDHVPYCDIDFAACA
ncbi:MAG TPA: phosphotransferase [Acidobacteriota bacterium]|nr:phosphotransferase [Acidobacteriota bacterium]